MVTPVKGSDIQEKVFVWRKEMKKRILIYDLKKGKHNGI